MRKDERRRYPRTPINTCATLSLGVDELGVYRLLDLSAGGALLEGRCPVPIGQEVTARLHFSPFEVMVGAVAVREEPREGGMVFAVHFELMAPEVRECVESLVRMSCMWSDQPTAELLPSRRGPIS